MPSPVSAPPATFRSLLRRFRRSRRASAALEFALVAPTFCALLFAIIETAMMFFASQVLETIAQDSSRTIFTGQARSGGVTQDQFKTTVCSHIPALFSCEKVWIDVEKFSSFSSAAIKNPVDATGNYASQQFDMGGPGDVIVVQLAYKWPVIVTGLGYNIANLPGSMRLLRATAAFKNEP